MAANRTIVLKGDLHRWHDEAVALNSTVKPGYLITYNSAGKAIAHATDAGKTVPHFAKEDGLRGGTRDGTLQSGATYYVADDVVLIHRAVPGDRINAKLSGGQVIVYGDYLISDGDGKIRKATAGAETLAAIGIAREALDLTGDPDDFLDIEII